MAAVNRSSFSIEGTESFSLISFFGLLLFNFIVVHSKHYAPHLPLSDFSPISLDQCFRSNLIDTGQRLRKGIEQKGLIYVAWLIRTMYQIWNSLPGGEMGTSQGSRSSITRQVCVYVFEYSSLHMINHAHLTTTRYWTIFIMWLMSIDSMYHTNALLFSSSLMNIIYPFLQ